MATASRQLLLLVAVAATLAVAYPRDLLQNDEPVQETPVPAVEEAGGRPVSAAEPEASGRSSSSCPEYFDITKFRTTNFTDFLNTTVSISPRRPSARVPTGQWIEGRWASSVGMSRLNAEQLARQPTCTCDVHHAELCDVHRWQHAGCNMPHVMIPSVSWLHVSCLVSMQLCCSSKVLSSGLEAGQAWRRSNLRQGIPTLLMCAAHDHFC
jgi:hypothetical protein